MKVWMALLIAASSAQILAVLAAAAVRRFRTARLRQPSISSMLVEQLPRRYPNHWFYGHERRCRNCGKLMAEIMSQPAAVRMACVEPVKYPGVII